jgi:hypothetical protein
MIPITVIFVDAGEVRASDNTILPAARIVVAVN